MICRGGRPPLAKAPPDTTKTIVTGHLGLISLGRLRDFRFGEFFVRTAVVRNTGKNPAISSMSSLVYDNSVWIGSDIVKKAFRTPVILVTNSISVLYWLQIKYIVYEYRSTRNRNRNNIKSICKYRRTAPTVISREYKLVLYLYTNGSLYVWQYICHW